MKRLKSTEQHVLSGAGLRIGIATSRFNTAISDGLFDACHAELIKCNVNEADVTEVSVAGALELPLILQKMATCKKFDALIALGCVIRGDTYHFEIVAEESAHGLMTVQLDHGVPIANGVLTTDTEAQAKARVAEKGKDVARVAVEMAHLMRMAY